MARHILVQDEFVISKIFLIRGKKVMFDNDLAELYGVTTGNLNKAVRRNSKRFPDDFMFRLKQKEFNNLMLQNETINWGGRRTAPYVFTEQGVAMLSSVLNSKRAIVVNIQIMRIYSKLREMIVMNKDILLKLEQLERKVTGHDGDIGMIFEYLKQLLNPPQPPRRKIGFKRQDEQE